MTVPPNSTNSLNPTGSTDSTHSTSSDRGTGRYVFCPGSGLAHEQVFLEIQRGPKVRFIRCPHPKCRVKAFLAGPAWLGAKIGLSHDEARAANPHASIF